MVLLLLLVLWLVLLLRGAVLLWCLVATGAQQLRWRRWSWNLDNNVGGFTYHLSLETLLRISCVLNGADEAIRIDHRVTALDDGSITHFLAVLVVGELVVLHVEAKLIRRVVLQSREEIIKLQRVAPVWQSDCDRVADISNARQTVTQFR